MSHRWGFALFCCILLSATSTQAQEKSRWEIYGNARIIHLGSTDETHGLGGENHISWTRLRYGTHFSIDSNHSFSARLAYLESVEFEDFRFTLTANDTQRRRLAPGSATFDEFYYRYNTARSDLKIGRFQKNFELATNSTRTILRFMSNAIFVHWTDGILYTRNMKNGWKGEAMLEYQHQDHITYSYKSDLSFQNQVHNVVLYGFLSENGRDSRNIIQKRVGVIAAPNAYLVNGEFRNYVALNSSLVYDLPMRDQLAGGSFRVGAELGQNVATNLVDGNIMVISGGVNNVANRHQFMIEFARTGAGWLTPTHLRNDADEVELRYRVFFTKQFNFDMRYRIRRMRDSSLDQTLAYSTFLRMTYSFR
ncbi:MAG: hypothetical protein AAFW89_02625 [Bacteroidota bacterium]